MNEEHPLVKSLLHGLDDVYAGRLRACLELLDATFPYDMYYADAANDGSEFATAAPDEATVERVGREIVGALRACGFDGAELRKHLEGSEFFKHSPEMTDRILAEGKPDA